MKKLALVIVAAALAAACTDAPGSPTRPSGTTGGTTMSENGKPPGQNPSGNPAHAPGCSNPNTVPSSDCKNDDKP